MKTSKLLRNRNGFTLIELLAAFLIIVVALLGVYIGIVYADIQIKRNIVERSAVLIASGECDYQYRYYRTHDRRLDKARYLPERVVVLDTLENGQPIYGYVHMDTKDIDESNEGFPIDYKRVEITVSWIEPFGTDEFERKSIAVVEDMYYKY
ncbi:MAG: prepilin-type N-terminal cleavage/methylation domain-containing protein [Candidatus Cloacimonetes bacterium]|nr:prepilin-type N-terminal cleavage/methylation domain-containing protein [Candidatus Cloacimonadota bacterium]